MAESRERERISFSGHDGPDDPLPGLPGNVGDHIRQLNVHLQQRLLHVLDMLRLVLQQHFSLPR